MKDDPDTTKRNPAARPSSPAGRQSGSPSGQPERDPSQGFVNAANLRQGQAGGQGPGFAFGRSNQSMPPGSSAMPKSSLPPGPGVADTLKNTIPNNIAPPAHLSHLGHPSTSKSKLGSQSDYFNDGHAKPENKGKNTLGRAMAQPNLLPTMKRAFIVITAAVLLLAAIIYLAAQQFRFSQSHKGASNGEEAPLLPKGKKLGTPAMHQALMAMAAQAVESENTRAAARIYGHAAEEARLAGPAMNKQYIDALFAQGEVYQYNLSDPDNARPCFEKVLKAQLADPTTKPSKLANTYNDLADALVASQNEAFKDRIVAYYGKAIALAKSCNDTKGQAYYAYYAGDYYFDQAAYDKSYALAKDSLAAFAKLKEPSLNDFADCHYLAARSLSHLPGTQHFEQANSEYEAALKTYEKAEADESTFVNCLRDAAWNKLRLGQRSEAKELFNRAAQHPDADDEQSESADSYMLESLR
ncbi:MAG: hypothetical protein KGS72_15120 [Cyanobacteria bacterium REEB67]|nr:hypothetical protein [Cyanobacteria bacterium REEB67]